VKPATSFGHRGVLDVEEFLIPPGLIEFGHNFLRQVGQRGFEGLILWAGRFREDNPKIFDVVEVFAPKQNGFRGPKGVGLTVDGNELFRMNAELYRRRLLLAGQVHSHPTEAYHSSTDDHYATVTIPGGLSLVVPDFASRPFDVARTAVYRLAVEGQWVEVTRQAARSLIHVDHGSADSASAGGSV
jgi:hypothetical protein